MQLQLKPLNLIIGPNASGKSNVFKGLRFLHDAVSGDIRDWRAYDSQIDDLRWFGVDEFGERPEEIEISVGFDHLPISEPMLTYETTFKTGRYLEIQNERLRPGRLGLAEGACPWLERYELEIRRYAGNHRKPRIEKARSARNLTLRDEGPTASVPSIGEVYRQIAGWRFFNVDSTKARRSHFVPEIPEEIPALEPDASNLSAFLYALWRLRNSDLEAVMDMISRSVELPQKIQVEHDAERGGSEANFYFLEAPFGENRPVRPESISDGTIRLLAHVALLLADRTVTLACLEEPDNGLHPRLMLYLADVLRQAIQQDDNSQPFQILIVTHSPELMDCFDLAGEAEYIQVYVAERSETGDTVLIPVTAEQFAPWLERYRLGEAVRRHFL